MDLFKIFGTIAIENGEAVVSLKDVTKEAERTAKGFTDVDASASKVASGGFSVLKGAAANLVAHGFQRLISAMGTFIKSGVEYQMQLEQYTTSFEVMTGSAQKAAEVTERLATIAAKTPFELNDVANATQLLMNYGFAADDAVESMMMLGDISQGQADKMNRIATAYGQMSSAGKVLLQDVKQMIEAGFNPLQEISETTGESMDSLYDRISKGTLSVDEITASMQRATSEGGRYFNSMTKQSETLSGRLSTLKDTAMEAFGDAFGGVLQKAADVWIPKLTDAVEDAGESISKFTQFCSNNFESIGSAIGAVAIALGSLAVGSKIGSIAKEFAKASAEVTKFMAANTAAAIAQGTVNGTLTLGQIAVGLLTGQISLATAAQSAWNAAMAANPIGLVIGATALLAIGLNKLSKPTEETIAALVGVSEGSEEAAAKVDELTGRIRELEAADPALWSDAQQAEYEELCYALIEAKARYEELIAAEQDAATTGGEAAAQMATDAEEFGNSAQQLIDKFTEVYEGYAEKVGKWFEPFETAKEVTVTSIEDMMAAMQSQMEFNNSYSENLQSLREYGLQPLALTLAESGTAGAEWAASIVSAVESAGGASSEKGQEIINGFRDMGANLDTSKSNMATTMAELETNMETSMSNIVSTVDQGVSDVDKGDEARTAAINTLQGYIDGVNAKMPEVLGVFSNLGAQITSALQASIGTITINFSASGISGLPGMPSIGLGRANGLERVPYDGYPAVLHRDEMVLPASQADYIRSGAFAEVASENNAAVVSMLGQILDAIQNGSTQETVLKLNDRELGRAVRGYVYA